jgi:hypothetical protein
MLNRDKRLYNVLGQRMISFELNFADAKDFMCICHLIKR